MLMKKTWKTLIQTEQSKDYFINLEEIVNASTKEVYPPKAERYKAFEYTEYEDVKILILGQDPYHQKHQAMGLSFSVNEGIKIPPSLINIYKELESDLGINKITGDLSNWAKQGVFLLNTLLSVEDSSPLSHQNIGWEIFTDKVIETLSDREDPVIFILWGNSAREKKTMIKDHHYILEAPHPSPLSAYRGFFGSKPFSRANKLLIEMGKDPIDWSL